MNETEVRIALREDGTLFTGLSATPVVYLGERGGSNDPAPRLPILDRDRRAPLKETTIPVTGELVVSQYDRLAWPDLSDLLKEEPAL